MSELEAGKLVDVAYERRVPPAPPRLQRLMAALSNAWYELRKSRTATIGAVMLVLLFGACIATPWIATHDPIKQNYRARLAPPSEQHLLGTDRLGRDIYSRLLYGGRRLVTIAVVAVALGLLLGVPFGVLAGYWGGMADTLGMRIVDGLLAFPGLLLYLLFVTVAQAWKFEGVMIDIVLVGALGLAGMPEIARLARGSVLAEKQKEYVEAARAMGDSSVRIALSQVLPNIVSPLIVTATVRLGFVILIVAALSFLGLGTPPPTPDWGADLSAARDYMETHPLMAAFPGLAICYTVLAFNLFGDGLRDILDPRLAER
ncbi:MAG: ABC transporter permease [Alphaproteobacteria bacterium]|nr:ABC transporter permease [Alphaproteobacteria bacterium]MCW5742153.1 ABC transporter permease [Alphaproteobacteria bacterium]